jgi:hypothetical protein
LSLIKEQRSAQKHSQENEIACLKAQITALSPALSTTSRKVC